MKQIDFLAAQPHYFDHIAPIWDALPEAYKGTFWVTQQLFDYASSHLLHGPFLSEYDDVGMGGYSDNPVLVASYGDLLHVHKVNPGRKILMMEHGTGHTFGKEAYPNGIGKRDWVNLFLSPNQYTVNKIQSVRSTPCVVIGTPKLDSIVNEVNPLQVLRQHPNHPPLIAIGFHWGSQRNRPPESGSAFEHYKDYISELAKKHYLLAYGHPLARQVYEPFYESINVEYTSDFYKVMRLADVCINDLSSVLYEFLVTGKPVIVLNAPWFRRDIQHGLRFWDYSDVGINVEHPDQLLPAIKNTLDNYFYGRIVERGRAVQDLFPYLGRSSERAAAVIVEYLKEQNV